MQQQFLFQVRRRSSVLVVALWALMILTILSAAIGNLVFSQIRFTNFFIRSSVSLPLARAAYYDAVYEVKQDKISFDTEKKFLKERIQEFKNNCAYKYYFQDEQAKININNITSDILKKFPGLNNDLAEAILKSNHMPFQFKEDIMSVDGITKDKFNLFKDLITVYGDGKVNINTVSIQELSLLGLEDDLIKIIMRYRQVYVGVDGEKGTDDDGAFLGVDSILSELRKFEMLTLRQEQELLSIKPLLIVKSKILRLNVSTKVMGKPGNSYSIIIDTANDKILSWNEQ